MSRYVVITGDHSAARHTIGFVRAEFLVKAANAVSREDVLEALKDTGLGISEIFIIKREAQLKAEQLLEEYKFDSVWANIIELPFFEDIILPEQEPARLGDKLYIRQSDVIDFIDELERYGIRLGYKEADGHKEEYGLHIFMPGFTKRIKLHSMTINASLLLGYNHNTASPEDWGEEELTGEEIDAIIEARERASE